MTRAEFSEALKKKYIANESLEIGMRYEVEAALFHSGSKLLEYFSSHESIMVSVSGGADSDCVVHLICSYFPEFLDKVHFVFVNTGLEFDATKRHLSDLEIKYGITIDKIRGKSVVWSCKHNGFPILNKVKAHYLDMFLRRTPKGYYLVFEANDPKMHFKFTEAERNLARYLDENNISVSAKCCDISKKEPLYKYSDEHHVDLQVTGERKAEGGQRAVVHKSCFEEHSNSVDKFMPLFWWSDDVKAIFKKVEGIRYSDCYEVYGMKRTGCCGCPFGKDTAQELEIMMQYEPQLFKACMHVFGQAYELTDRFNCRKKKKMPDMIQLRLF